MTNARVQRILIFSTMALFWGLAASLWNTNRHLAYGCLIAPLLIIPLVLAVTCALAAFANLADSAPQASFRQWLSAWVAECRVAAQVFLWWQPFRHLVIADQLQLAPGRRGMVLVHGFFCNRAMWTDWMIQLRAEGRAFVSVDLEPAYGPISDYAAIVEQAIAQVEKATSLPPVIVCHSMGGLAIRAWAACYAQTPAKLERVHSVFTLGTPHQGTKIAHLSFTENGQQMRPGSLWVSANASQLPDGFAQKCTCFYSNCDNIVFPCQTGMLPGADNRFIAGRAHVELAFVDEIKQACWTALG